MTFINEMISDEDWEKYNFETIDNRWNGAGTPQIDWAIDREKNIWLREFNRTQDRDNNGEWDGKTTWDYYWKGLLLSVDTTLIDMKLEESTKFMHYRLLSIDIPFEYEVQRQAILQDFCEAISTYGLGGIFSEDNKKLIVQFDY